MNLADALHARGLRATSQRLVIRDALVGLNRHVTAEQVRDAVGGRLPGVSLPTVYATLDLFEQLGLVRRLRAGAGALLYDPRPEPHEHAVCRVCGRVEDLDAAVDASAAVHAASASGFRPDGADTVVSGVCARCAR
jgi:Fur family ferric uptake transcriptional regulator/Fur family peroxide stress response transcriptional regulator